MARGHRIRRTMARALVPCGLVLAGCITNGAGSSVPAGFGARVTALGSTFASGSSSALGTQHIVPGEAEPCIENWLYGGGNDIDFFVGFRFTAEPQVGASAELDAGIDDDSGGPDFRLLYGSPDSGGYFGVYGGTVEITALDPGSVVFDLHGAWTCDVVELYPDPTTYEDRDCQEDTSVRLEVYPWDDQSAIDLAPEDEVVGMGDEGEPCGQGVEDNGGSL